MDGDIMIIGSDGLFDNLEDDHIIDLVRGFKDLTQCAELIAKEAKTLDDVTVVVAEVKLN